MKSYGKQMLLFALAVNLYLNNQTVSATAMTPVYGSTLLGGVGNTLIYLDYSSGVGDWEGYITTAANNWMYTGWSNPIYITFVSSDNGSDIVFMQNQALIFHLCQTEQYWLKQNFIEMQLPLTLLFHNGLM